MHSCGKLSLHDTGVAAATQTVERMLLIAGNEHQLGVYVAALYIYNIPTVLFNSIVFH